MKRGSQRHAAATGLAVLLGCGLLLAGLSASGEPIPPAAAAAAPAAAAPATPAPAVPGTLAEATRAREAAEARADAVDREIRRFYNDVVYKNAECAAVHKEIVSLERQLVEQRKLLEAKIAAMPEGAELTKKRREAGAEVRRLREQERALQVGGGARP